MPTESCVSVGDKQSLPSPSVADFVSENTESPHIFAKSSTSGLLNPFFYPLCINFIVRGRPAKVSPRYYNSLAYTLHVLRNGESDSDDSDSESSSSLSFQGKRDRRPERITPQVQVSKPSPRSEDQGDIESVFEEMRMLGLPTSFGHSKFRFVELVQAYFFLQ